MSFAYLSHDIIRNNREKIGKSVSRAELKERDEKAAWQNMIATLNRVKFFSHIASKKNTTVLADSSGTFLRFSRIRIFCSR